MWEFVSNNPIVSTVLTAGILGVFGFIGTRVNGVVKKVSTMLITHEQDHNDIKAALVGSNENDKLLLKSKIQDIHGRMMANGRLGPTDRELANELYARYHEMGGNGYIKLLVDEINEFWRTTNGQ